MAQKVRIRKTRTIKTMQKKNGKSKGVLIRKPKPKVKRKVTVRRR